MTTPGAGRMRAGWALGPIAALMVLAIAPPSARAGQKPGKPRETPTPSVATAAGGAAAPARIPTYNRDVAPIIHAKCLNCHRKHQVGPFPLETYEQARKRAQDIASVTGERSMPPWKPTRGVGPALKHDQSLTPAEVATILAWADADAPRGDPKDLAPSPKFAEGWKLGEPDLILEPSEDFALPAAGSDVYRCFVLPTNLAQDMFLEAIDFQAGVPAAVHHMIGYIDSRGLARQLDAQEPGPGYTSSAGGGNVGADELGFWTAGSQPHRLPDGVGIRLPRQSDIILQVHYHPTGKPGKDRTRLGLYFARKPVKQALHWNNATNYAFRLPAGKDNVEVKASWYIPVALDAIAVAPHMHQLGKDMKMTVVYPDGREKDLIHIEKWDPSWQSAYHFETPVSLPAGSVVKVVAHFDNSAHARNPNSPPKEVTSGSRADDEMCVGYIAVVKKGQNLTDPQSYDDLYEIFLKQRMRSFARQRSR